MLTSESSSWSILSLLSWTSSPPLSGSCSFQSVAMLCNIAVSIMIFLWQFDMGSKVSYFGKPFLPSPKNIFCHYGSYGREALDELSFSMIIKCSNSVIWFDHYLWYWISWVCSTFIGNLWFHMLSDFTIVKYNGVLITSWPCTVHITYPAILSNNLHIQRLFLLSGPIPLGMDMSRYFSWFLSKKTMGSINSPSKSPQAS